MRSKISSLPLEPSSNVKKTPIQSTPSVTPEKPLKKTFHPHPSEKSRIHPWKARRRRAPFCRNVNGTRGPSRTLPAASRGASGARAPRSASEREGGRKKGRAPERRPTYKAESAPDRGPSTKPEMRRAAAAGMLRGRRSAPTLLLLLLLAAVQASEFAGARFLREPGFLDGFLDDFLDGFFLSSARGRFGCAR